MTKLLAAALAALVATFAHVRVTPKRSRSRSRSAASGIPPSWNSPRPPASSRKRASTVEPFYTDGGAATLTTVLSGSADIGLSNGLLGVIGAYVKGAPVRVISAQMTGAGELYWYARAESGIKSLKDAAGKTVAFSSPGSSSNLILLALLRQAQVERQDRSRPAARPRR